MGPTLDKKAYPILCDNEAIVHSLTSGTSCSPDVMDLLRRLFLCAAKFNFTASAKHVPGIHNTIADSLSCFQIQVFRLAAPAAETHPTTPAQMPLQNMKFILHNSLATNTRASYNSGIKVLIQFCLHYHQFPAHHSILPASEDTLLLFAMFLSRMDGVIGSLTHCS